VVDSKPPFAVYPTNRSLDVLLPACPLPILVHACPAVPLVLLGSAISILMPHVAQLGNDAHGRAVALGGQHFTVTAENGVDVIRPLQPLDFTMRATLDRALLEVSRSAQDQVRMDLLYGLLSLFEGEGYSGVCQPPWCFRLSAGRLADSLALPM
jgi:hypothetical protein